MDLWINEIHFGQIRGCHVANLISPFFFFKSPSWPIRGIQPHFSYSAMSSLLSPLPYRVLPFSFDHCLVAEAVHALHVEEAQPPTSSHLKSRLEMSNGASPIGRRNHCLMPLFLANSGAVQPHFEVKPPVLEPALHPLQNHTPFDGRIIAIEKSVTI